MPADGRHLQVSAHIYLTPCSISFLFLHLLLGLQFHNILCRDAGAETDIVIVTGTTHGAIFNNNHPNGVYATRRRYLELCPPGSLVLPRIDRRIPSARNHLLAAMLSSIFSGPLVLVSTLVVLLFATPLQAVPYNAMSPIPRPYWQATAGLFYHRCSSPTQVEFSRNQKDWYPSALCKRGTCCSNLSKSPMCTREACDLVEKEIKQGEEYMSRMKKAGKVWTLDEKDREANKGNMMPWD